ncbi:MAG: response regulator [Desulfotignum sp.]
MGHTDYPGKIRHGNYSHALKAHVEKHIDRLAAFDRTRIPVIPYICVRQDPENDIWYEFAGKRFCDLMGCSAVELADMFKKCILERRVYDSPDGPGERIDHQPTGYPGLTESDRGVVEAIYKLQLPDGEVVWLKDQAMVTAFTQDCIQVSSGCFTVVTREMEAEEALKETRHMLKEKARALNLARKIQEENAARLSSAVKQLDAARKEAERANKAKSEFLAVISHEIRNPMNGIVGTCDLIMAEDLTRQQAEYLEIFRSSALSLLGLINDILDFSKIEAGKLEFQEMPFDIRDVVEEVSDIFLEMIARKHLELVVDIDPEVPEQVIADPTRLRQVLINLISNALKFTRQGEIVIQVAPVRRENSVLELGFRVTDTGIGIAPEHFDYLFESFTQINGTETEEYGGTGLGLAICRQIVEMMNGTIGVDSYPGQGSTFYFNVPVKFTDTAQAHFVSGRALIAMKNQSGRQSLSRLLESWGMCVTACGSAFRAVNRFSEERGDSPYSLVIMDMALPDIGDPEISRNLRSMTGSADLPIALTRMGKNKDLIQSGELGFTRFMTKPVKQSILKDLLRHAFGGAGRTEIASVTALKKAPSFSNARILLVEDNPVNLKIGSKMLEMAGGVAVDTARNGLEAIDKVQKNDYDAVLIDIQMPHLDGIEASRVIRRQFSKARLPIIAMSAHAGADHWKACLEAGINDYILKPVSRNGLFDVLNRQIGSARKSPVLESPPHAGQSSVHPAAEPTSLPGLDIPAGLERLGGDAHIYAEILTDFCQTYVGFEQEMKELIRHSEFKRAADLSHSIKGASGNLSATALFESAKALELACRQKQKQDVPSLLAQVQSAYDTVCRSAGQFCEQIKSRTDSERKNASPSVPNDPDKDMAALSWSLLDSLDQCDPVLSENLVREIAPRIQDTWKKEMDHLINAVKNYQFDDARKYVTELMEKAGV